jgi:hypothetical protein
MATTKVASSILVSVSNAAAATKTSSSLNLTAAYGALILAKVTNGSTAPTTAATVTVNVSSDGSTWRVFAVQSAGLAASGIYSMAFDIPLSAMFVEVVFAGNTGQAVTVEALAEYTTGI